MLIYWILFVLVLLVAFYSKLINNEVFEKIFYFIIILSFIVIGTLRSWRVGTDTKGYLSLIPITNAQNILSIIENERDPFFWIFIKALSYITNDYTFYFLILAVVFWTLTSITVKKYSNEIFISLMIFISFRFSDFYMNAMRQGFSIAIVFYSIKYIFEKKPIKFVAILILASLFHQSAIFFIFAYLLQYFNFLKIKVLIPIVLITTYIFRNFLYHSVFVYLISENKQYAGYAKVETEHGILYLILYAFTFIICYFFYNKLVQNLRFNILFNIVFIGLMLQIICLVNVGFARIAVYYSQYFVLIVPYIYKQMVNEFGETKSFAFWFFFVLGLYIVGGPAPGVVPYRFYWE